MPVNDTIVIIESVDGLITTGRIRHRSKYDISVEIAEPFHGLSRNLHIASFAGKWRNFTGNYGVITAERLLGQLYEIAKFLTENASNLQVELASLRERISALESRDDFLSDENRKTMSRVLRGQFRKGEVTQSEYQRSLKELATKWSSGDLELRGIYSNFVVEHITKPLGIPATPLCPREILAFIEECS